MKYPTEITVLMPCLNEAETLERCILIARHAIQKHNLSAEILIADNGSTDGSVKIAESLGAKVVQVQEKGYGNALVAGINHALGKYIIMGDSDNSYDFGHLYRFVRKLREGYDLVMGNRFAGGVEKGAILRLLKYIGNPVLSFIGRLFFKIPVGDFHCGLRGFNRQAILNLDLCTSGMEFASEMVVKSALSQYRITEVRVKLYPDGRTRAPHLNTWRDGWRHLWFLLLYSPEWLFLYQPVKPENNNSK
jgi:glycosyltransferase involved in cell wall biosynthesis